MAAQIAVVELSVMNVTKRSRETRSILHEEVSNIDLDIEKYNLCADQIKLGNFKKASELLSSSKNQDITLASVIKSTYNDLRDYKNITQFLDELSSDSKIQELITWLGIIAQTWTTMSLNFKRPFRYKVVYSNQSNIIPNSSNDIIDGVYITKTSESNDIRICARQKDELAGYKYIAKNSTWLQEWRNTPFEGKEIYPTSQYPWLITDLLNEDHHEIMLFNTEGIKFYQLSSPPSLGLELLSTEMKFLSKTLLWGRFYANNDIGVLTRSEDNNITFEMVESTVVRNKERFPLTQLTFDQSLPPSWTSDDTDFFLTKLFHNNSDLIGLRTKQGFEFYRFNDELLLEQVFNTSKIAKSSSTREYYFFADLTHQLYQDILYLNDNGLFVYQYNNTQNDYKQLNRHPHFTKSYGWLQHYSNTIRLFDVNNDGHDDLIFTGVQGLTVFTFNIDNKKWKKLIDPNDLYGSQRYSTVVGTLPAIPPKILQPSIFTQDVEGKLQWARIVEIPENDTINSEVSTTTVSSIDIHPPEKPRLSDSAIPEEIKRKSLSEKPILRWAEQWDVSFLKKAVNPDSGQVELNIPLIDVSAITEWNLKLSLAYHSQSTTSDLLGEGWLLPLDQDHIYVEYQGSIFSEDAHYILVTQGQSKYLKLIKHEEQVKIFELLETDNSENITIKYYQSKQQWIIESPIERVIYGTSDEHSESDNATQWSLEWPYWRGVGCDKMQLRSSAIAWYVSQRINKESQKSLYYYYQNDKATLSDSNKNYTRAIRLKAIRDKLQMELTFDYDAKKSSEFTASQPIDDKGNIIFPVPLARSHYLRGYTITTANYQQKLEFITKINDEKRFLVSIEQQLSSEKEILFQFNYDNRDSSGKQVMTNCALLPYGLTANFSYKNVTLPAFDLTDKILSYPIEENIQIAYGSDYTIMAYQEFNEDSKKIILKILNREMTKIIIDDCSIESELLSCPSVTSKIESFTVTAYHDSFFVNILSEKNNTLFIFYRQENEWLQEPTIHEYNKQAIVKFNDKFIAVAQHDGKNKLILLVRTDDTTEWKENTFENSHGIDSLVLYKRIIVTYDNHKLQVYYRDSDLVWKSKVIKELSEPHVSLNNLDLDPKYQQELIDNFNKKAVQILNNNILLNLFYEKDKHLYSQIHLFLLDSEFKTIKNEILDFERVNINELTGTYESEGSFFHSVYIKEDGKFKLRIKDITGKIREQIVVEKKNRNLIYDEVEETIKKLNKEQEKFLKTRTLIDWNLFQIQMNQNGAQYGNDTFIQITGSNWIKKSLPLTEKQYLGKHLILKTNITEHTVELYEQKNEEKLIDKIKLSQEEEILIIRYPVYIAYKLNENYIKVLSFKDDNILSKIHHTKNEMLMAESDGQKLITKTDEECIVRPMQAMLSSTVERSIINQMTITDGSTQRSTGYDQVFNAKYSIFSKTVSVIPGNNKHLHGWHETRWSYDKKTDNSKKSEYYFNSTGQQIQLPLREKSSQQDSVNDTSSEFNPGLLFDRHNKSLISDFSPYRLNEQMVAYYGFESYEIDQPNNWHLNNTKIIKDQFALTGKNYLKLNSSTKPSFLKKVFQPRDQNDTYVATCWIRCNIPLQVNNLTSYLKADISTSYHEKFLSIPATVERQLGNWFYLELEINLNLIHQFYLNYVNYNNITDITQVHLEKPIFNITLKVEAPFGQVIDLDHIRFSPISHEFQAKIYHPITGQSTEIIENNGLIMRTIYNRLEKKIAQINENNQLEYFSSTSMTGKLGSISSQPNVLTFRPDNGIYENFIADNFTTNWNTDNVTAWYIAPGQLWHKQSVVKSRIKARDNLFDNNSAAIRFYFALQTSEASLSLNWEKIDNIKLTRKSNNTTLLIFENNSFVISIPSAGELIVMLEKNFIWLWIDGVLLMEKTLSSSIDSPWFNFEIEVQSQVLIEDIFIMNNPKLQIEYHNDFGEKTQVIELEDASTILVTETLYDELGRAAITTKTTRIKRTANKPLLAYQSNFVEYKNPSDEKSVWKTSKLNGIVDRLNFADKGFAYSRIEYAPNPLNDKQAIGLPGSDFSITGKYKTTMSSYLNNDFLAILFPTKDGFYQKIEKQQNGSLKISVFNKFNKQVAIYLKVPGFKHVLSTYEYDDKGRLTKILPPMYHDHEMIDTSGRLTVDDEQFTDEQKLLQNSLATHFTYDKNDNLIKKKTPDSGTTKYQYNNYGQMRFMISSDSFGKNKKIVYFNYDKNNQLISTGHMIKPVKNLKNLLKSMIKPTNDTQEYQAFDYGDDDSDPSLRGRRKKCITRNEKEIIIEKLDFNSDEQLVARQILTESGKLENNTLDSFEKQNLNDRKQILKYPITLNGHKLHLVYSYNRLGQLVAIENLKNPSVYASFTYHATGKLASEQYQPNTLNSFNRTYQYNSPDFLEKISDPFLTEEISYTSKGYGQEGFGDGIVMRAAFKASWPTNVDGRWFQADENDLEGIDPNSCILALKHAGYLDKNKKPIKQYMPDEQLLPRVCYKNNIKNIAVLLRDKQVPTYYGHRYAYNAQQTLISAKYFNDKTESLIEPLQSHSFATKTSKLTNKQSQHIWNLLTDAGYIITDRQYTDPNAAIGKIKYRSIISMVNLQAELYELNEEYIDYEESIKLLIIQAIAQRKPLSLDTLTYIPKEAIKKIKNLLSEKGYLSPKTIRDRALNNDFLKCLKQYTNFIPEIIGVLLHHFLYELGKSPFDVESYRIDANGNHRLFYTGSNSYELIYHENSNKINKVKLQDQIFDIKHDFQGNVIQALHKGIKKIEYHPVSQRTTRIQLTDGRILRFYYDAQGERILKRVFNNKGKISHEIYYLRDEQGNVLVDKKIEYLAKSKHEILTAYIYGPRGLIGFIRNNNFYSVTTDHLGSIRLVIKSGKVVAAYDYLPYGEMMRSYGNDPHGHIMYRYTGQEWDEETQLYNYHARLYDPSIGRFYQPDPKSQYFSPYKYAGNSPISMVDPDGEYAVALIALAVALAGIGAYIAVAARNNRWDPTVWDFKDSGTWLSMGGGALTGALLPFSFAASVPGIVIGISFGVGVAYASMATFSGTGNPLEWKFDRPGIYNAMFEGFSTGMCLVSGISAIRSFSKKSKTITSLSEFFGISRSTGKTIFLSGSYFAGGAFMYKKGMSVNNGTSAFWEWDLDKPDTWLALAEGFNNGIEMPQLFLGIIQRSGKSATKSTKSNINSIKQDLKVILKNPKHHLFKVTSSFLMAYFMGSSANNELDMTKWDIASISTYEGISNGILFGKDISKMLKYSKHCNTKKLLIDKPKITMKNWSMKFRSSLKNIISFRKTSNYKVKNLNKWEIEYQKYLKRDSEVLLNNDVKFLVCQSTSKRIKRGLSNSAPQAFSCSPKAHDFSVKEFTKDQRAFFRKNIISTSAIEPTVANNKIHDFTFKKTNQGEYDLTTPKSNDEIIKAYWLKTSKIGKTDDDSATLKISASNPKANYIFTAQVLGSSIGIKYDRTKGEIELYHYSQPNKPTIYINEFEGKKIKENGRKYLTEKGDDIPELKDDTELYDENGKKIHFTHNAIIVNKKLYNKNNEEIKKINGEDTKSLISKTRKIQEVLEGLKEKYTFFVEADILNCDLSSFNPLFFFNKEPIICGTVMIYRKSHEGWEMLSQKTRRKKPYHKNSPLKKFTLQAQPTTNDDPEEAPLSINNYETNSSVDNFDKSINPIDNNHAHVSSGSSRLEFWPVNFIKQVKTVISSFITTGFILNSLYQNSEPIKSTNLQKNSMIIDEEWNSKNTKDIPTLTEMGDHWLECINIDGLLTWGILLFTRKQSGYRQTRCKLQSYDNGLNVELSIRSYGIVNEFMNSVFNHAETCGIQSTVFELLNDVNSHDQAKKLVCHKLSEGEIKDIPWLMYNQLIEPIIHKIVLSSGKKKVEEFTAKIFNDISNFEQQLLSQDNEWLSYKQNSRETVKAKPYNYNINETYNVNAKVSSTLSYHEHPTIGSCVEAVGDAVTHAIFVGTDTSSDGALF
ncbi:hypothetical protein HCN44_006942 [Aphidius gifuensis]|uniref:Uncharacterized protein n=1 Tax=Aphidius gifuensis TaxID=684658 RepID=A0A834XYE7_APHGI|nr:hypothetical protein HCN44_006942 [Aphidius gifuensis]